MSHDPDPASRRVNVVGLISGHHGLGVAARGMIAALLARGFDVATFDLDDGRGRKGFSEDFAALAVRRPRELPHAITLFILPPATIASDIVCSSEFAALLSRDNTTNAVLTFWELLQMPASWARALEAFDAVVAPSPFVEGLLESCLSGTQVIRGMLPVDIPDDIAPDRARFGIPEQDFVVVSSFDPLSDPERKNPFGAVEAFKRAFHNRRDVHLVFKINLPRRYFENPALHASVVQPLVARLATDDRITLVTETLAYRDVLSLYASADAFISLHRAEGLGLGLLESMALAKPAVATAWSGNKAFMTPSCSCLVTHRFVPVQATLPAYTSRMRGLSPVWADPDLDDAASWLRQLADDISLRHSLGAKAQAAFRRYRDAAARLEFMDDVLAIRLHQLAKDSCAARRENKKRRLTAAHRLVRRHVLGLPRWLTLVGREQFDRHLGWRLKGKA